MSFAQQFENRWKNVIAPAISSISNNGEPLNPIRVDARRVSDSILTEILGGIANSLLILVDISTQGYVDERPMRNENVMYELGLAHATRLPEEVLIFRSDDDRISFDVSNVRVNGYEPESSPDVARELIVAAIKDTLREVDLEKSQAVQTAVRSLDASTFNLLIRLWQGPSTSFISQEQLVSENKHLIPIIQLGQSLPQLLSARIIETGFMSNAPGGKAQEMIGYRLTKFGKTVKDLAINELLTTNKAVQSAAVEAYVKKLEEQENSPN